MHWPCRRSGSTPRSRRAANPDPDPNPNPYNPNQAERADAEEEARSSGVKLVDYEEDDDDELLVGLAGRTAANMGSEKYK